MIEVKESPIIPGTKARPDPEQLHRGIHSIPKVTEWWLKIEDRLKRGKNPGDESLPGPPEERE